VSGQEQQPFVWGHFAPRLTPVGLAAAVREATIQQGRPWAIFADIAEVMPEVRSIEAFLPPTTSTDRFRKGAVLRLECRPATSDGECVNSEAGGEPGSYVQVADTRAFTSEVCVRSNWERPIAVNGEFSDEDLVSLVAFIRAKPQLPPLPPGRIRIPSGVSADEAIRAIWSLAVRTWVIISDDDAAGETAEVRRTSRGWELVDVRYWTR